MISKTEQTRLHDLHPNNVVRLILGRDEKGDRFSNRYDRAAHFYKKWRADEILKQDEEPAIYAYRQDYDAGGQVKQRLGFISRVRLEEFGSGAFPHENTLSGPKADRLRLMQACQTNFSSIFSLFSDPGHDIEERLKKETSSAPHIQLEDPAGVAHRLWKLRDPSLHQWLAARMDDKTFIIADGHHRYETALEYRRLMSQDRGSFRESYDYVMMFMAPLESTGLTIFPFHRMLMAGVAENILEKLQTAFDVEERPLPADPARFDREVLQGLGDSPDRRGCFALYLGGEGIHILRLKPDYSILSNIRPGTPPAVAELDVTILHKLVFEALLDLEEPKLVQEERITFVSKPTEALDEVKSGEYSAAFFLRPTKIDQVWNIATSGYKMPQKSTNFYPKLTTGLVFNEF